MPLDDFIDEVLRLLADPPPSGEIAVPGVHALRYAERDGTYEQRFNDVNTMVW
jgi:hypothetical protein